MANFYWVGGSGNWSDSTNHWATSSNGIPSASNVPTATDNVIFDNYSSVSNSSYTVTISGSQAICNDFIMDGPDPTNVNKVTLAGSGVWIIYGSLNLVGGSNRIISSFTGGMNFYATSTGKTITMNGVSISSGVSFAGVGGEWILQDNFSVFNINISAGIFDTNNQIVTTSSGFSSSNSNVRTILLRNSTINVGTFTLTITTNLTFDAGTSTIIASSNFSGGGLTYNIVQLIGAIQTITGNNVFSSLSKVGTAVKTNTLSVNGNQTIGTLTISGNSVINRTFVQGSPVGSPRTISASTVTITNSDFRDIVGAGSGNWDLSVIAGGSGDCGGNSGIIFTSPVTTICSNGTTWSTATWSIRVPLPQDTANFNGSSRTIAQDMPRIGSVDFTGSSGITFNMSTICSCFGSINLTNLSAISGTSGYTLSGNGSHSITMAGKSFGSNITLTSFGGTYTLQDTAAFGTLSIQQGTFDFNSKTTSCSIFQASNFSIIIMGSSTFTCSSTFSIGSNVNFICGTSTIICNGTNFGSGGKTYNIVQINSASMVMEGGTFTTLTFTGTAVKINNFSISGNITVIGTLTISGNSILNRVLVKGYNLGTPITLSASTVIITNSDFKDITGAGSGNWNISSITGGSGDCGGNSGITFTSPVTTNWQSGTTWSTATWSVRVPLPQDTATFTTAGSATITQDMPRIGSVDFTGSLNKGFSTAVACSIFGSFNLTNLQNGFSGSGLYTFEGRGSHIITSAGISFPKPITIDCYSGEYILQDDIPSTVGLFSINSGTFTANNKNIKFYGFASNSSYARTINMGSGIWENFGLSFQINQITGLTINPGTSILKFTDNSSSAKTFSGGITINNIWIATQGTGNFTFSGNNTFNDLKIDAGRTVNFTAGTITTVKTFTALGSAGNIISLNSNNTSTFTFTSPLSNNSSPISCDYLNIQHCICLEPNTWYAGSNSINNQGVATAGSGWIFTVPQIVMATNASFLFLMI